MTDSTIRLHALELREAHSRFTGDETVDEVVEVLLEERLASLREDRESAKEKQAELRDKFGIDKDEDETAELTDAAKKRRELRERFSP